MKLTLNIALSGVALLLGIILALVPVKEETISVESLTSNLETASLIEPKTLSDWLIQGRNDCVIIDVRSKSDFDTSNIESSRNIPAGSLFQSAELKELGSEKMLFVVGKSEAEAAQAALIMKSSGYHAYVIRGGYPAWVSEVLNPQQHEQFRSQDEINTWKKNESVAAHFKGEKQVEVSAPDIKPVLPKFTVKKRSKGTDEGC